MRQDFLIAKNESEVFTIISRSGDFLRENKFIHRVVTNAEAMYCLKDYKFVKEKLKEKDWSMCLSIPGVLFLLSYLSHLHHLCY